jgi:hypothetical protein
MWPKLKLNWLRLGLLVMTVLLTACAHRSPDLRESPFLLPPPGILRLEPGQTHQALAREVWHSAERYQALELQLVDALASLKQARAQ